MKRYALAFLAALFIAVPALAGVDIVPPAVITPASLVSGLTITPATGTEIVVDGGFADTANWTEGTGWSLATGAAVHTGGTGGTLVPAVALVPVLGKTYAITFTLTAPDTRSVSVSFGGYSGTSGLAVSGPYTLYITAATTGNLTFTPSTAGTTITLDNVSVTPVTSAVTASVGPITFEAALTNEFSHQAAMRLNYTVDKTGAFNDTGLEINMTDTTSGGTSLPLDIKVGGTSVFSVSATGTAKLSQVLSSAGYAVLNTGTSTLLSSSDGTVLTLQTRAFGAAGTQVAASGGTFSNTSGSSSAFKIYPTYNQASGTADNIDLLITRTETALGSGAQKFVSMKSGSAGTTEKYIFYTTLGLVIVPPAAQTIAAGNVVTADGCGGIKPITAAGAVTTDTTNTFTAPAAANAGCCMDVVNVGAQNITLDTNATFFSPAGLDVLMTPNDSIRVCNNGTAWYAVGLLVAN